METPTWNIIEKYSDFNYWTPATKELSQKYGAAVDATRQARLTAEEAITAANAGAAGAVALKDMTKLIATARKLTYEALQIEVETRQTLELLCKAAGDDYYAHVKLSEAKLATLRTRLNQAIAAIGFQRFTAERDMLFKHPEFLAIETEATRQEPGWRMTATKNKEALPELMKAIGRAAAAL